MLSHTLSLLAFLVAAAPDDIVVTAKGMPSLVAPVLPDRVLATMRGGVRLDNGFDLALGIDIQTRVDGLLVLHTVYASDGPTAGVRVYTDGTDGPRTAPGTVTVNVPGEASIPAAVIVDRSPTGTTVVVGGSGGAATVNLLNLDPGQWLNGNGQQRVAVSDGGPPVTQGPGAFSLATGEQGAVVTLDAAMLRIQHLIGQATGVVTANTANDRTIDTVSSINVDLQGISPSLLGGLFTADQLAFDAMSRR